MYDLADSAALSEIVTGVCGGVGKTCCMVPSPCKRPRQENCSFRLPSCNNCRQALPVPLESKARRIRCWGACNFDSTSSSSTMYTLSSLPQAHTLPCNRLEGCNRAAFTAVNACSRAKRLLRKERMPVQVRCRLHADCCVRHNRRFLFTVNTSPDRHLSARRRCWRSHSRGSALVSSLSTMHALGLCSIHQAKRTCWGRASLILQCAHRC